MPQLLAGFPQGALGGRFSRLHMSTGEADLTAVMVQGGSADFVEQVKPILLLQQGNKYGVGTGGILQGRGMMAVIGFECVYVHRRALPFLKV